MRRAVRNGIMVGGTVLVTAACVWVLAPFTMPESRIMAMICASFPLAAWIAAARLHRAGRSATADVSLLWTFAAAWGFLLLTTLASVQLERAEQSNCSPAP
jgi:hypothetical protein